MSVDGINENDYFTVRGMQLTAENALTAPYNLYDRGMTLC